MSGTEDSQTAVTEPSGYSEPVTKSGKTFATWWVALLSGSAAVVTVVAGVIKVPPLEVHSPRTLIAVILLGSNFVLMAYVVWGRQHGGHRWLYTVILSIVALLLTVVGVRLLVADTKDVPSPKAGGSSRTVLPTSLPTTTTLTSSPSNSNNPAETPNGTQNLNLPQGIPTQHGTSAGPTVSHNNPTPVTSGPTPFIPAEGPGPTTSIPIVDTVRYAGDFRLDASHESVDLDLNPPQAYGVVNELAVGDNAIWVVPPDTKAALWSAPKPAIRQQCVDTVATANPAPEYFDTPKPGLSFCVLTSDKRYAFVQVKSVESKNYNLSVVVWEK